MKDAFSFVLLDSTIVHKPLNDAQMVTGKDRYQLLDAEEVNAYIN